MPDLSEILIGLEAEQVKSMDFEWFQESNIFLPTSVLASVKCQLGDNSGDVETYLLIVYLNRYDRFYLVDPNKYDQVVLYYFFNLIKIIKNKKF